MVPAASFASQADRVRASSVMWPIMTECVAVRQIARGDHPIMTKYDGLAVTDWPVVEPGMKLRVVGTSGSGKSALAARLERELGLPRLDLDAVFWDAGWTHRDVDEARRLVTGFVAAHPDGWVADGNWTNRLDGLLDPGTDYGADAFVWLDHSRALVMSRVIRRTLRRAMTREELWHGNRERPLDWFTRRSIMRWAWTQHPVVRARMQQRIDDGVPVIRLRGPREVDAWVRSLAAGPAPHTEA